MARKQMYAFRSDEIDLESLEVKTLVEKGRKLFSLLRMTEEAKDYLKYHPELAEVIEKW